jgi:hypothetical protein
MNRISEILPAVVQPETIEPLTPIQARTMPDEDESDIVFQHTALCQTSMPYRDPGDIEKLRAAHQPSAFVLPANGELVLTAGAQTSVALVRALTAIAERVAELKEPHFLTLKQARAVSGLPASFLHAHFVRTGRAVKTGAGWRIPQAHLDEFARNLDKTDRTSKMSENLPAIQTTI